MAKDKKSAVGLAVVEVTSNADERTMQATCRDGHYGPNTDALVEVVGGIARVPMSLVPYFQRVGWLLED